MIKEDFKEVKARFAAMSEAEEQKATSATNERIEALIGKAVGERARPFSKVFWSRVANGEGISENLSNWLKEELNRELRTS